jgi:hypothetical protein
MAGFVSHYVAIGAAFQHGQVFALGSTDDKLDGDEPDLSGIRFSTNALLFLLAVYPDQKKGLHFFGEVGPGWLTTNRTAKDPSGIAYGLGGGYDWFVGEEWSLGVLGRVIVGAYDVDETSLSSGTHVLVWFPSVLGTATFN